MQMGTDTLNIYVRPGSSKTKIEGLYNGNIKIKIAAPPEKGKANKELIGILSKILKIPKSKIIIASGINSNYKTIRIDSDSNADYYKIILNEERSQTI